MSTFAEILRRQQNEQNNNNNNNQHRNNNSHHSHGHRRHHDENKEDIDRQRSQQSSNMNSSNAQNASSWAGRLNQSFSSQTNTPTSSSKVQQFQSKASAPISLSSVADTWAPVYTEEESLAIKTENQRALDLLGSSLPYYPIMLVLCGIPGSGKSTFARRLIAAIPVDYRSYWISLNQDALGDRQTVMRHTQVALHQHQNTIIDRCNFNAEQRQPWIHLAHDYHISTVIAFELPDHSNVAVCAERAYKRGNSDGVHPGHPDWNTVCARMNGDYSDPMLAEGFSAIYKCRDADDINAFIEAMVRTYDVMPRPHTDNNTDNDKYTNTALSESNTVPTTASSDEQTTTT